MPYDTITDLPDKIRAKLPTKEAKRIFMSAFNRAYEATGGLESASFASAWGAVKAAGYKADDDGEYHKTDTVYVESDKTSPTLGDVHVDSTEDKVAIRKEDYKLPESARNNARKVLEWKKEHGDEVKGMTETGWRRARQLADNTTVGAETVKAMAQFARHRKNSKVSEEYKSEPWKDRGYVAWLGWGGDSGINWAVEISDNITKNDGFTFSGKFTKMNEDKRLVYGWASVVSKDGVPLKDLQGDIITSAELAKAAHKYMIQSREAKEMHTGSKKGELVESIVFTEEIQKTLNIDLGKVGWFVGFKVYDDETWAKIKSGELPMFSIGGRGKRERA